MEESLSDKSKILERVEEKRVGPSLSKAKPRVTVVIPAYNSSSLVSDTLESVFAQNYKDYEVVLVNDGSDDTAELESNLEPFSDNIVYARQNNLGASEARNLAIVLSRGGLLAFLDADDIWLPDYLEKQIKFLDENRFDMVYCDAELFGNNYLGGKTYMETTPSHGEVNPISLISATCNVITSGTIVRREMLVKVGMFDPRPKRSQDFDLWFRLAKHGARIGYQRDVLLKYRVSATSLSGSNVQRAERSLEILDLIREKYEFTPEELRVWENQYEFRKAQVDLEKGKLYLIEGNYSEAQKQITRANRYYKKPKLFFLRMFLKVSPVLTLKLFKKLRPSEVSFIETGKD